MQKNKQSFGKTFKLIWKISDKKSRWTLVCLFALSILRTLYDLLPPVITAIIIARIQNIPYKMLGFEFSLNISIIGLVAIAFGALFLSTIIASLIRREIRLFGTRMMGKMNLYAVGCLLGQNNKKSKMTNGEIAYIIKNSAESIPHFIETFLVKFFAPVLTVLITMVYIASMSLVSFAVVFVTIVLLYLIVLYRVSRNKRILNDIEKINGNINNNLLNDLDNFGLIKFYQTKAHEMKIFSRLNDEYYKQDKKKNLVYIIYWILIYLAEFACSILVIYFILQTTQQELLPSIIILLVLLKIYSSTENLGFVIVEMQQYAIKILRINKIFDEVDESQNLCLQNEQESSCPINEICIKNFEKSYDKFFCKIDSAEFKKNEISTIVGVSGSGKTTLIKCLLGLENCDKSEIIINKNQIVKNLMHYNNQISVAFQNEQFLIGQ